MKLFLVTLLIGAAAAAQLTGRYLPPGGASTSGGHAGFLQGPSGSGAGAFGGGHASGAISGGGAYSHGGAGGGGYGGHSGGAHIPILEYENVNNGDGSYHFKYSTGNGISQHEQGHVNNPGTDYSEQVVEGSYSYTGDDGHTYTVHYKADANGFQPVGDHLPTPPPIPDEILKSIAYNAAHAGSDDSGAYKGSGAYGGSGAYSGGGAYSGAGAHNRPSYNQGGSGGYHY